MPRFSRTLVVVIGLLVLVEVAVRVAAPSLPQPLTWSSEEAQAKVERMATIARKARPPIVFVGSSVADLGIDPGRFGSSSYNASVRGSSMEMIDIWTSRVVVPALRPTTVVLGLSSRELTPNDGQQQRGTRDFLRAPAVRHLLGTETFVDKADRRIAQISDVYKYRTVLRQPMNALGLRKKLDSGVILTDAGWDRSSSNATYDASAGIRQFLRSGPLGGWRLGGAELTRLRQLVDRLRAGHIDVVMVDMPVTQDYVDLHPHGRADYDSAVAAMRQVAGAAGARFLDEGIWETTLFADPIHLNGQGAGRLSRQLAQQLSVQTTP